MAPLSAVPKRAGAQLYHASQVKEVARRRVSTVQLDLRKGDRERVVILGSGWAGFTFCQRLDKTKYQPVVISPRSYFVFTPLLASTAVGTLEFRNAIESVRGRGRGDKKIEYFQGWGDNIDFDRQMITVEENATEPQSTAPLPGDHDYSLTRRHKGKTFDIEYDKLVIAVGCYSQTFNTPGVKENALFLKDVGDARSIRTRILDCFEKAALPSIPESVRRQLLHFAVVGGGPTGVEFSAELFDLCNEDLQRHYPSLINYVRITIYDVAPQILSMFDKSLSEYALNHFQRDGIEVQTSHHINELKRGLPVKEVGKEGEDFLHEGYTLNTKEDGDIGVGMCVWSTGLMMNPFIRKMLDSDIPYPAGAILPPSKDRSNANGNGFSHKGVEMSNPEAAKWHLNRHPKTGALMTDEKFRLQIMPGQKQSTSDEATQTTPVIAATISNVFALGDVAIPPTGPLPATAQVASQEAIWLAKHLNKNSLNHPGTRGFRWRNLGMMAYLGGWKGIMQTGTGSGIRGWLAWVIWRGAYLTKTISWRNKVLIPVYWAINWVFGRDISRF